VDKSDKHTKLSPDLLEVQLSVISNSRCGKAKGNSWDHTYRNQITRNMLCTQGEEKDACQGDSGGPLVVRGKDKDDQDVQIGVVSWGIGCAYLPGVFARVSEAYDWIREVVCEHGTNLEATSFHCGVDVPPPLAREEASAAPQPAPARFPQAVADKPYWRTVIDEDFDDDLGEFRDGGSDARRINNRKGRAGVVKLQHGQADGAAASIVAEDVDVAPFTECRAVVSFYLIALEKDDAWRVEYAPDGERWRVAESFSTQNYRNRKWWDGRRATFPVNGASRIDLRLRCLADSNKDDVLIDSVKLECR